LPLREESRPDRVTASDNPNNRNPGSGKILSRTVAIGLAVFGFLPIANWIAGGHAAPWYRHVAQSWISGTAIVLGAVVILVILSRRRAVGFAANTADRAGKWFAERPRRNALIISVAAAALYALVAVAVFDARPLFIDEIVQLYQARVYATGHLVDRVGPFPEFFGALNVVSAGDHQFGQFPPGGPAHLMLGVLVGAPWLVTPILGGATVYSFARFVRHMEPEPAVALAAILLLAFSPFMVFMAASQMNHVPTLLWIVLAWLACLRLTAEPAPSRGWALLFGFAAGVAATIRPVDALAMTAPAFVLWLSTLRSKRRLSSALLVPIGLALPIAALLVYNNATTGSPLLFGYELMWGKSHSLGFHASPWGIAHSPLRGLELLSLYSLRLQSYLFETPTPSLLPVIITLAVAFGVARFDRIMLWAGVLLAAAYFAYWHDGFYLGPRFFFVLTPLFALLAARAPRALGALTQRVAVRQYALVALATSLAIGVGTGLPARARLYSQNLVSSRHEFADDSLGGRNWLVFVRESWGSQVLARLWGREVERPAAELLYRSVDTCVLDSAVTALEKRDVRGSEARAALWPLLRDSMNVLPSTLSPDATERVLPGSTYSAHCATQIAADREGLALYPPLLAERRGAVLFARDLGERNGLLAKYYPDRATYLLLPPMAGESAYRLRPLPLSLSASR
jgi:4-amino-4-deoxy-L-arabinose transferase-like glycosyltransferase